MLLHRPWAGDEPQDALGRQADGQAPEHLQVRLANIKIIVGMEELQVVGRVRVGEAESAIVVGEKEPGRLFLHDAAGAG